MSEYNFVALVVSRCSGSKNCGINSALHMQSIPYRGACRRQKVFPITPRFNPSVDQHHVSGLFGFATIPRVATRGFSFSTPFGVGFPHHNSRFNI
jgi:hypothetical protein